MHTLTDQATIAAIATPPTPGAVGIIRISGELATKAADHLFHPTSGAPLSQSQPYKMRHGWLLWEGKTLDEVLAVHMPAPHSYTGESVVELHCHGGVVLLQQILDILIQQGLRLAHAGEFTLRAVLNGKMDLTRAEAVNQLIHAPSLLALNIAANQLKGALYDAMTALRTDLLSVAGYLAAGIDFADENDVVFASNTHVYDPLMQAHQHLGTMLEQFDKGQQLRQGVVVALLGPPNAGKSSLLNRLLHANRAIVTDIPGTTRDTLEAYATIRKVAFRLIDTAGIRDTDDLLEQEGIRRSHAASASANLNLLILDGNQVPTHADHTLLTQCNPENTLIIVNKQDCFTAHKQWAEMLYGRRWLSVSALQGSGIDLLESSMADWALGRNQQWTESPLLNTTRQKQAAQRAHTVLESALRSLQHGQGEELASLDVQDALGAIGEIVGETTTDDILAEVFSRFCIGK